LKREDRFFDSFLGFGIKYPCGLFFVLASPLQLIKGPEKVPAKVPGDSLILRVHRLSFLTTDRLAHPFWHDLVYAISRVNHGLTQLAPLQSLQVVTSALSLSFCQKRQHKVLEAVIRGQIATGHGGLLILSGQSRSRGDRPGF